MRPRRSTKALLVTIVAGLWLAQGHASVARTIVFVLGAALLTWAWIASWSGRPTAGARAPRRASAPGSACPPVVHKHRAAHRRIERKPRGRIARDVRCPVSRATARARRSTRR